MATTDLDAANIADLRAAALSWENFKLAQIDFQIALRFHQWARAQAARDVMMAELEANCDAFQRVHRRIEMAGG